MCEHTKLFFICARTHRNYIFPVYAHSKIYILFFCVVFLDYFKPKHSLVLPGSMNKRITIKDIAIKAEVSTGTVDRVLHNRGNVAPEVKKRVMEVVEELGYKRNILASALAYNRTYQVIALIPNPQKDPYWEQTNIGINKAIKSVQNYGVLVDFIYFNYNDPKSFRDCAAQVLDKNPAAVLFSPMFNEEATWLLQQCKELGISHVMINTNLDNADSLSYIGQDSYQSGVLGARLLNFGLLDGQSACILNLDYSTKSAHHLIEKERGFRAYFSKEVSKEIQIFRENFEDFEDENKLRSFLKTLLEQHRILHGIFVTNSRIHKIVDSLNDLTDRNIKLVGFDLIEPNLKFLYENKINFLINQNPVEQGFQGIMSLFNHLVLKESVEKIQYLPLDIVVKENVEYYLRKQQNFEMVV